MPRLATAAGRKGTMAKEICISSTPHETRLAILEDDQLAEIYYERENEYTLAGSIYNGRVTRVLPGMQSAFVDLGLERDAFLYVTDFLELEDPEESDELERAAIAGGNQPIREVRSPNGQPSERGPRESRPESKPESRQDQRGGGRGDGDRSGRDRRPAPETGADLSRPELSRPDLSRPDQDRAGQPSPEIPSLTGQVEPGDDSETGARRWRGRRRRRGGRVAPESVGDPVETEASAETYLEPLEMSPPEVAPEIQASAGAAGESFRGPSAGGAQPGRASRTDRSDRAPAPFVLPGESLSKYGGEPAPESSKPEFQMPAPSRPASSFKPSTLIESPIEWDGSGLLPGESISRHRGRQPEPETTGMQGELHGVFSDAATAAEDEVSSTETIVGYEAAPGAAIDTEAHHEERSLQHEELNHEELNTEELVQEEQPEEPLLSAPSEAQVPELTVPEPVVADPSGENPFFARITASGYRQEEHSGEPQEGSDDSNTAMNPTDPVIHEPDAEEAIAEPTHILTTDPDKPEPKPSESEGHAQESDRSASHHVDPLPPSGFRLFGFGGKKKSDEPAPAPERQATAPVSAPVSTTVSSVSAFAPGKGLVEEEVIEGEEFDNPRHHGKTDDTDLDEYEEEEKLQTQIRSGELGEMLQEAHLDHRIQLNFDDKAAGVDGEDVFDIDEEEEEEPAESEAVPAGNGAPDTGQPRRERGGRGRRGGRPPQGGRRGGPPRRTAQASDLPIISDLLKPGQEILVQIAKEPIAKKGARITSHIALPGRFLVFMPTVTHVGVSRKIASDEERQRLKRILTSERGDAPGGFIVRTAAEGASEEELRSDLRFLIHLWDEIKQRSEASKSPALIYHDLSLIERILRDQISANFSSIWVDSEADYERIVRFLNRFSPSLVRRVKLYTKETPLFEHFGIQDEISKALRSKVWLKSGGSIVINQTEALVAIDINTGKYVGKTARLEDTIVKTNLDAIPEIVRQIRLRDLGGIIIIDFIDMDERKNRFKVMAALEEALKNDRAPTKVLQFNDFGLVAITRKRVKQSLERTLSIPCPTCQATGMVKSPVTVCNEIYTELRKMRKHFENPDVLLRVHPETVKALKANNARWLTEFEELVGKNILVKSDATLHPEQFDIQS
jgi:ribonuclease G